jgi:hypothetical protein
MGLLFDQVLLVPWGMKDVDERNGAKITSQERAEGWETLLGTDKIEGDTLSHLPG